MKLNIVKKNILLFIFIFNCFWQNAFAQKNDTHVTIKKGLNDDFITLSANGSEVRLECSEWYCTQASCKKWKCINAQYVSGYKSSFKSMTENPDGTISISCDKVGTGRTQCKDRHPYGMKLTPENDCYEKSNSCGDEHWNYGEAECWLYDNLTYQAEKVCVDGYYTCDIQKCIAWKVPGDKVLSLIPDIGISSIDLNLIEY